MCFVRSSISTNIESCSMCRSSRSISKVTKSSFRPEKRGKNALIFISVEVYNKKCSIMEMKGWVPGHNSFTFHEVRKEKNILLILYPIYWQVMILESCNLIINKRNIHYLLSICVCRSFAITCNCATFISVRICLLIRLLLSGNGTPICNTNRWNM